MSVLIHEQGGRRIIFYPDDRHLRQYTVSCPTLISIEVWPDAASAENALRDGLVTWENDPDPPEAPVAPRWQEAFEAGQAPRVVLRASHEGALAYCSLTDLNASQ
jgi:hypothetical protein